MKVSRHVALLVALACSAHAADGSCPTWLPVQFSSNCYGIVEADHAMSWREFDALCRQSKPGSHIAVFSYASEWQGVRRRFTDTRLGIGYMYNATSGVVQDLAGARPSWDMEELEESGAGWTRDACVVTAAHSTDWQLAECNSTQTLLCKAGSEAIPSYVATTASPSASPSASAAGTPSAAPTLSPSATATTPWATIVPSTQAVASPSASVPPSPTASSRPVLHAPYPWPAQNLRDSPVGVEVGNASQVALRVKWPTELTEAAGGQAGLAYLAVGLVHALATTLLVGCDIPEAVLGALPSSVLSASCSEPGLLFVAAQGWCWSVQPPAGAALGLASTELVITTLDSLVSMDSLPPACSSMGVPRLLGNDADSLRDMATLFQCLKPDIAASTLRAVLARIQHDPTAVPADITRFSEASSASSSASRRLLHAELDALAAAASNTSAPITVQVLSVDVGRFPSSTTGQPVPQPTRAADTAVDATAASLKIAGVLMIACAVLLLGAVAYHARRAKRRHAAVAPVPPLHQRAAKPTKLASLRTRRRNAGSRPVQPMSLHAPRASELSTRPLEHEVAVSSRYRASGVLQVRSSSQRSWRSGYDDMSVVEISGTTQLDAEL